MTQKGIAHMRSRMHEAPPMAGRILQRKCACGEHTSGGGECAACVNHEKPRQPLQTKLHIGAANDNYESEADRVADEVVSMQQPVACERNTYLQARPVMQRRSAQSEGSATDVPAIVQEVLASSGRALDSATRAYMEPRFGHDFSQVRIHDDWRAGESANAVNATAYTVGQDVVFQSGSYNPGSTAGRRLLAHELVHTVQQGSASVGLSRETIQRVAEAPDDERGEALAKASRFEGILKRWALRLKRSGAVMRWITRLDEGKILALRRLRVRRARRVVLLASQSPDLKAELEDGFLAQLARFVSVAGAQPTSIDEKDALEESDAATPSSGPAETPADTAETLAQNLQTDFNLGPIISEIFNEEWTVDELAVLRNALEHVPARDHDALSGMGVRKLLTIAGGDHDTVTGAEHFCDPAAANSRMDITQGVLGNGNVGVILHEVGHAVSCIDPDALVRFQRLIDDNRQLRDAGFINAIGTCPLQNCVANLVEFFAEAYREWLLNSAQIRRNQNLQDFFDHGNYR
ncbi:DUF4157 domain-containing protein [Marinobacter sp. X15-166B]|uniref:eCIS core domain-containing protein n=1 Tax=Marinobacter sp. X15-166B TaxID=1897620 RepID=UPI0018E975E3|nr:DUF4157 domain-containing protein [Marinobacter sp. X15-166B]